MNIVGLQAFYYSHATALISDGDLEFFCEEEKLSRVKGGRDGFPLESLKAALAYKGLSLGDVDEIAYPMDPWRYSLTLAKSALQAGWSSLRAALSSQKQAPDAVSLTADRLLATLPYTPVFLGSLIRHRIRYGGIPGRLPPIRFVPHHEAHAASAYYSSGLDEATILIVDGVGERESTSIWHGRGREIRCVDRIPFPNSLGEFYAAFTEFCGFKTYQQEGKLMGLAAYGGHNEEVSRGMDRVLRIGPERYDVAPEYTIEGRHSYGISFSDALVDLFGKPRGRDDEIQDWHRDIAFGAQQVLELATLEMVKKAVRLTGCPDVCFSGGVAMNCKLNGTILHSGTARKLFVLPASNDAGVALGAAMVRSMKGGDDPRFELQHTYYGPSSTEEEIEAVLINSKAAYRRLEDYGVVAELLADSKVVGLFTGRNEFGARALGARSILADPRDARMWDVVNDSVKHRERWRPFAPVLLEGHEASYLENPSPSRYMMKAYQVLPEKRDEIPAVTHVDGSCRPQSISAAHNPAYHGILEAFHRRTGVPVLMNTSFNVRGEPIVTRPSEALRCYFATGMDALVIGPFLLQKG